MGLGQGPIKGGGARPGPPQKSPAMAPARTFPLPLLLLLLSPRPGAPGGCSDPEPPWRESLASRGGDAPGTLLHLRVRPFSSRPPPPRGLLFPGGPLFSFVRRVYRCCQERRGCGSVRGIPGRPAGNEYSDYSRYSRYFGNALRDDTRRPFSDPPRQEKRSKSRRRRSELKLF